MLIEHSILAAGTEYVEQVIGVDPSPSQIEHAKKWSSGNKNIQFICASAEKIPLPDHCADLITSAAVRNSLLSYGIG